MAIGFVFAFLAIAVLTVIHIISLYYVRDLANQYYRSIRKLEESRSAMELLSQSTKDLWAEHGRLKSVATYPIREAR